MSSERRPTVPASSPTPRPARVRVVAVRHDPAPVVRALAVGAALLLALAVLLATAPRAAAHNALQGTDPADGATVATAPERITLTFDQPAQALGTEIVVLGPDGATVSTGAAELVDQSVSQALTAALPAGVFTVQWRVTSADGHPLSGEFTFTATEATAVAAPEPAATAPATPDPPATATPEAIVPIQGELAEDEDAGLAAGLIVAIVVAVLAAGAVTVFVVRERRRSKDGRTED